MSCLTCFSCSVHWCYKPERCEWLPFKKKMYIHEYPFPHVSHECAYIVWIAGTFFSALQTCSMADVHLCIRSALNVSTRKLLVKPCNQLNGPILRWTQTPEAEYSHNHFSIHFSIIGDGTSTIATSTNQQRKSTRQ